MKINLYKPDNLLFTPDTNLIKRRMRVHKIKELARVISRGMSKDLATSPNTFFLGVNLIEYFSFINTSASLKWPIFLFVSREECEINLIFIKN